MPREGHDNLLRFHRYQRQQFQSTCPARGTTKAKRHYNHRQRISIHVPREGHDVNQVSGPCHGLDFNPRAPRGARRFKYGTRKRSSEISIHVPREGHDTDGMRCWIDWSLFQSTCPARGTTCPIAKVDPAIWISIHVPREGHDRSPCSMVTRTAHFNPRAPRGARHVRDQLHRIADAFQSTCPARGTTADCPSAAP